MNSKVIQNLVERGTAYAINAHVSRCDANRFGQHPILKREFLAHAKASMKLAARFADTIIIKAKEVAA